MVIYAKVVYNTGFPVDERNYRESNIVLAQKEFCLREYEHLRDERMRRSGDDFVVCDSIDINRYDAENHLEIVTRVGKVARHFNFTKVIHVEIDEEMPE